MNEPVITILDEDDALADELRERIYEFNADATGIDDGRLMFASIRDERDALIAGAAGWTWAGCGYLNQLWVRTDYRGRGLGTSSWTRSNPGRGRAAAS